MSQFIQRFRDFARMVRANPSKAVGEELDRLMMLADRGDDAAAYAYKSPVANVTWMQRGYLSRTELQTPSLPMQIPFACRITGCQPVILLRDSLGDGVTFVEPPIQAIDAVIQLNRTETFTARTDKLVATNQDTMVCSLAALDNRIRSLEMELNADDNVLSVQFKWALPLTGVGSVEQYVWGGVDISINWFVDPTVRYGEMGRYAKPAGR
jgi:hypothetical protein